MSKEPNETLVMTTCKCREHGTNLVMTRTWFEEQLQSKIQQGIKQEREHVIELLQRFFDLVQEEEADGNCNTNPEWDCGFQAAIASLRNKYND